MLGLATCHLAAEWTVIGMLATRGDAATYRVWETTDTRLAHGMSADLGLKPVPNQQRAYAPGDIDA